MSAVEEVAYLADFPFSLQAQLVKSPDRGKAEQTTRQSGDFD